MHFKRLLPVVLALLAQVFLTRAQSTNPPPQQVADTNLRKAGIKPVGDWSVDPAETQELNQMFASATAAANSITPGPDYGAQRHAVDNSLREEIENFLMDHPNSAYRPALHLWLGRRAQLRCGYSLAMDHYRKTVSLLTGAADPTAQEMFLEAGGKLAKLLAVTGQIAELDALVSLAAPQGTGIVPGTEWTWAREMRQFVLVLTTIS